MKDNMKITYHKEGQFLYPDLAISGEDKEPRMIGKYGLLRKTFLKNHRPVSIPHQIEHRDRTN